MQQTFDASCISLQAEHLPLYHETVHEIEILYDPVLGCLGVQNFKTIGTIGDANSHSCLGFIKDDVTLKGLMVVQAWKQGPAVPVLVVL